MPKVYKSSPQFNQTIFDDIAHDLSVTVDGENIDARRISKAEVDGCIERSKSQTRKGNDDKLHRRIVNCIRHKCTRYNAILSRINTGYYCTTKLQSYVAHCIKNDLRKKLTRRVLDAIEDLHPEYREEINRQRNSEWISRNPDEVRLPFGQFKGRMMREMPSSYLCYQLQNPAQCSNIKSVMQEVILKRLCEATNQSTSA